MTGRFQKGNPGGPGNPLAAKVQVVRAALFDAVTADDVQQAARRLVALAVDPDPKVSLDAIQLLFDRLIGKPTESIALDVTADTNTSHPAPVLDLTADEVHLLEKLTARTV